MDPVALSTSVIAALAPFLPLLLSAGESALGAAGEKLGTEAGTRALALWDRLRPRVESRPAALGAAQEVARLPGDADALSALRLQLRKLIENDPTLAEELERHVGASATAIGARSIAIGGSVSGGIVSTGDHIG
jgi:hypothetical protein